MPWPGALPVPCPLARSGRHGHATRLAVHPHARVLEALGTTRGIVGTVWTRDGCASALLRHQTRDLQTRDDVLPNPYGLADFPTDCIPEDEAALILAPDSARRLLHESIAAFDCRLDVMVANANLPSLVLRHDKPARLTQLAERVRP